MSELIPEGGWATEDFPKLSVDHIPYTANADARPDPVMSILESGWLYVDVGNIRLAIPDREEWEKFVSMGSRMFNTYEYQVEAKRSDVGDAVEVAPASLSVPLKEPSS